MFQEKKRMWVLVNTHPRGKDIIYSPKLKLDFTIPIVFTLNFSDTEFSSCK